MKQFLSRISAFKLPKQTKVLVYERINLGLIGLFLIRQTSKYNGTNNSW